MGVLDIFSPGETHHAHEIVSEAIELLGPIPKEWHENWGAKDYYLKRDGTVRKVSGLSGEETPGLKGSFEWCIQRYRLEDNDEITEGEKAAFLELIHWMLSYRQATVKEVLSSKWMVKYALPDY